MRIAIEAIAVVLHWTFDQLPENWKLARSILRTYSGHVGDEDRVRNKSKLLYQRRGENLEAWQEERTKPVPDDLVRLGLYHEFVASNSDLRILINMGANNNPRLDIEAMNATEQIDPAAATGRVPCGNQNVKS